MSDTTAPVMSKREHSLAVIRTVFEFLNGKFMMTVIAFATGIGTMWVGQRLAAPKAEKAPVASIAVPAPTVDIAPIVKAIESGFGQVRLELETDRAARAGPTKRALK